jgi:hypothetical protein
MAPDPLSVLTSVLQLLVELSVAVLELHHHRETPGDLPIDGDPPRSHQVTSSAGHTVAVDHALFGDFDTRVPTTLTLKNTDTPIVVYDLRDVGESAEEAGEGGAVGQIEGEVWTVEMADGLSEDPHAVL